MLALLHPLAVAPAAIFLGGLRLGSLTGLLLCAGVPRELGSIMVAVILLAMSASAWRHGDKKTGLDQSSPRSQAE